MNEKLKPDKDGTVDITRLYPNPDQPRKVFKQGPLEELALSIREKGLIEPIVITPDGKIIAGERRWRASMLEGIIQTELGPVSVCPLNRVPVVIRDASDREIAELALLENFQREDLSIMEEAVEFRKRLDEGWTKEELARVLGLKQLWRIDERLSLLNLAPEFRAMVAEEKIGPSEAFEMSRLPASKQSIALKRILSGELNTYNKLRSFVDGLIAIENQSSIFELQSLSADENESIRSLDRMLASVEKLIKEVTERDREAHLKKAGFRSDMSAVRLEVAIKGLQRIRKIVLAGEGVREAMAA